MQPLLLHPEEETLTTDGQAKDLVSLASSGQPIATTPKEKQRVVETVSLDVIAANICTKKDCLDNNPHRH